MKSLSQLGFEGGDDTFDKIRHLMEGLEQRLCLKNLRLADRYIESKLQLLIKFSVGGINEQFMACLHREVRPCLTQEKVEGGDNGSRPQLRQVVDDVFVHDLAYVHGSGHRPNSQQQAVFLDAVKSIKDPEQVIPTFIWFDEVNRVDNILPRSLYFSSLLGFIFHG